jgi:hypothetical protein
MKKIVILTAFALVAFGCSKTEEVKNTAPANAPAANTATNTTTAANTSVVKEETYTSGANPRADIISAAQKRQKLPFWSAKVISGTDSVIAEMQYAAPDQYYFKTLLGEAVVIGNEAYINETGKWEKDEEGAGDAIKEQISKGINEGAMNLKEVQITGKENLNGKEATVYFYKAGEVTAKIWLASDSGLELKNEIEIETAPGIRQKQTTIYDYDKPVTIKAPKIN